jgi:nitrate reductase NapE component
MSPPLDRPFTRPATRSRLGAPTVLDAVAVFASALAWTALVRLPLLRHAGADDAFYTEVALLWRQGVLPYVGAFDVKPPGVFAVLALVQSVVGPNLAALNTISIASDALSAALLMTLAARYGEPIVGVFAAVLYPILSEAIVFDPAYSLLAAMTTLAMFAAVSSRPLLARSALAGLIIGAACAVKHTAAFEGLAALAILLGAQDARGRRIAAGALFILAAALVPVVFVAYFAAHGAAGVMLQDIVGVAVQKVVAGSDKTGFVDGPWRLAILSVSLAPVFAAIFAFGLRQELVPSRAPHWALRLWLALALASLLAQRAQLTTYLGPVLAPGLLLSGLVIATKTRASAWWSLAGRLGVVGAAVAACVVAERWETLFAAEDMPAIESVAATIRAAHPSDGDRLYVVRKSAWLYPLSGLRPPTRFFIPSQSLCRFVNVGPARIAEAFAERPRFVVVGDPSQRFDCEVPGARGEIDAALTRDYREIMHVEGDFDTYVLYEAAADTPRRQ